MLPEVFLVTVIARQYCGGIGQSRGKNWIPRSSRRMTKRSALQICMTSTIGMNNDKESE